MSIITTGNFPQDLRPGIRMWFGSAYKMYETKYDKIFDVLIPEDRAYEEDVMMSTLGLPQTKTQGGGVIYQNGQQLYTTRYPHIQYGLGFIITQEMMEDGIHLKMGKEFSEAMKLSMLRGREIISSAVYSNAFVSTAVMEGGDTVCLGSNAHPTVAGNFSNIQATPTALSEAALEQMVNDVMKYTDNDGQVISVRPDKLIIPINLQFTAHRILNSVLQNNTADNAINAIRDMGMLPGGIVVDPYLTSSTNWFVKTDQKGLNFFNRKDITMDGDNEFDTNNAKFKALMRFSVGWSDPRAFYGVNI